MQLVLSGNNHFKLTDELRSYTEDKLQRIKRHSNGLHGPMNVHITFDIEHLSHTAAANVSIAGATIQARAEEEDMYHAIDTLADKLDGQLRKYREKQTDHHRD